MNFGQAPGSAQKSVFGSSDQKKVEANEPVEEDIDELQRQLDEVNEKLR